LGHVGYGLAEHIARDGARLLVADINADVLAKAERELGAMVVSPDAIHAQEADIFAPCALSHAVRDETVEAIQARLICGAANNQISSEAVGERLRARGITYCPDYIVNAGGIINVASELSGAFDPEWVRAKVEAIPQTLENVLVRAEAEEIPPAVIADHMAREKIGR
jgi:leucine dehydrogenase